VDADHRFYHLLLPKSDFRARYHSELCMAFLQWCPKEAIQFEKDSIGRKRYHHPDVKISDVLVNRVFSPEKS
jgi:hypothetical protein